MRTLKFALLPLLLLTGTIARGQMYLEEERLFKGLLSVGFNAAQVDGDGPYGYAFFGLHAGVGTMINMGKGFSTSLEMLYSQRGSSTKLYTSRSTGMLQTFRASFNYIDVPICLNYMDKKRVLVSVGVSPAVLGSFNLKYQGYDVYGNPVSTAAPAGLSAEPSRFDVSALAGVQFIIKERIAIGGRYSYSLLSVRPAVAGETLAEGQYHNVVTIRATYIIGNKSE